METVVQFDSFFIYLEKKVGRSYESMVCPHLVADRNTGVSIKGLKPQIAQPLFNFSHIPFEDKFSSKLH